MFHCHVSLPESGRFVGFSKQFLCTCFTPKLGKRGTHPLVCAIIIRQFYSGFIYHDKPHNFPIIWNLPRFEVSLVIFARKPYHFFSFKHPSPSFFPSPPAPRRGLTPLERELESIEGLGVSLVKPPAEVHPVFVVWLGKNPEEAVWFWKDGEVESGPKQKNNPGMFFWQNFCVCCEMYVVVKLLWNSFVIFSLWILGDFCILRSCQNCNEWVKKRTFVRDSDWCCFPYRYYHMYKYLESGWNAQKVLLPWNLLQHNSGKTSQ